MIRRNNEMRKTQKVEPESLAKLNENKNIVIRTPRALVISDTKRCLLEWMEKHKKCKKLLFKDSKKANFEAIVEVARTIVAFNKTQ